MRIPVTSLASKEQKLMNRSLEVQSADNPLQFLFSICINPGQLEADLVHPTAYKSAEISCQDIHLDVQWILCPLCAFHKERLKFGQIYNTPFSKQKDVCNIGQNVNSLLRIFQIFSSAKMLILTEMLSRTTSYLILSTQ